MREPGSEQRRPTCVRGQIVLLALVVACGGAEPSATTLPPTTDTTASSPTTATTAPAAPDLEEVVEAAVIDLAERLHNDPGEIELVAAEAVTWSDGSLGCPEPGKLYTQALVEGYRVVLSHDGTEYDYHAGQDRNPFLCDRPSLDPGREPPMTVPEAPEG